jgi:hypothetical protein
MACSGVNLCRRRLILNGFGVCSGKGWTHIALTIVAACLDIGAT